MSRLALVLFLVACGSKSSSPTTPTPSNNGGGEGSSEGATSGSCITTGCSGTICTEAGNDMMSTCEMKPEYACYKSAECKPQADGKCGWTQTDDLKACLASPPPL